MPEDLDFVQKILSETVDEADKLYKDLQRNFIEAIRDYFTKTEGRGVDHAVSALSAVLGAQLALWILGFEEKLDSEDREKLKEEMIREVTTTTFKMIRTSLVEHYKRNKPE